MPSGALDVKLQHLVLCTEFLDGWWSREPLRRSCVRCGWCRAIIIIIIIILNFTRNEVVVLWNTQYSFVCPVVAARVLALLRSVSEHHRQCSRNKMQLCPFGSAAESFVP